MTGESPLPLSPPLAGSMEPRKCPPVHPFLLPLLLLLLLLALPAMSFVVIARLHAPVAGPPRALSLLVAGARGALHRLGVRGSNSSSSGLSSGSSKSSAIKPVEGALGYVGSRPEVAGGWARSRSSRSVHAIAYGRGVHVSSSSSSSGRKRSGERAGQSNRVPSSLLPRWFHWSQRAGYSWSASRRQSQGEEEEDDEENGERGGEGSGGVQNRRACQQESDNGGGPSLPLTDALVSDPMGFLSRYPLSLDVTSLPPSAAPTPQGSISSISFDAAHTPDVNVTVVKATAGKGSTPAWLVSQQVVDDVDSLVGESLGLKEGK